MELQVVGIGKDFVDTSIFHSVHQRRAVTQPFAQNRVREIAPGLMDAGDGKALSHRAYAQSLYLRKDEPHPVRTLFAGEKLGPYLCDTRVLRVDEALEMVIIVHCLSIHLLLGAIIALKTGVRHSD